MVCGCCLGRQAAQAATTRNNLLFNSHSHNDKLRNLCYTSADGDEAQGQFRTSFALTSYHTD